MPMICTTSSRETAINSNRSIHTQMTRTINDIQIASVGNRNKESRDGANGRLTPTHSLVPSQPHPCELEPDESEWHIPSRDFAIRCSCDASSNHCESERHTFDWSFSVRYCRETNASIEVDVGVVTASPLRDFQGHIEQFFKSPR